MFATTSVSGVAAIAPSVCAEALVALGLELVGQLRAALLHDTPIDEDVHEIGLDVVEDPLVMRDHERAGLLADELADALGDRLQRIDVEAGVGLVEHRDA